MSDTSGMSAPALKVEEVRQISLPITAPINVVQTTTAPEVTPPTDEFHGSAIDFMNRQGKLQQQHFDALLLCNLIFRDDKVLLISSRQCTETGELLVYVPHTRIYGAEEKTVPDNRGFTYVRRVTDEASLADFSHAAIRTQTGLDSKKLAPTHEEIDLTTMTPGVCDGSDRRFLRATVQWEQQASSSIVHIDNWTRSQLFWVCEDELEDIPHTSFAMNLKAAVLAGFELRRKARRVDSASPEEGVHPQPASSSLEVHCTNRWGRWVISAAPNSGRRSDGQEIIFNQKLFEG